MNKFDQSIRDFENPIGVSSFLEILKKEKKADLILAYGHYSPDSKRSIRILVFSIKRGNIVILKDCWGVPVELSVLKAKLKNHHNIILGINNNQSSYTPIGGNKTFDTMNVFYANFCFLAFEIDNSIFFVYLHFQFAFLPHQKLMFI